MTEKSERMYRQILCVAPGRDTEHDTRSLLAAVDRPYCQLTPWGRVVSEKLMVAQMAKNVSARDLWNAKFPVP